MKLKIRTDQARRIKFSNSEIDSIINKYIIRTLLNDLYLKDTRAKSRKILDFLLLKLKFRKISSKTKIVRRCVLTGRARVSHRLYGISRIKFRELMKGKHITDVKKHSW